MKNRIYKLLARVMAVTMIFTQFMIVAPARAASFDTMSDLMSRLMISTTADHVIQFELPTGIDMDVAGGEDIIMVDFPADFAAAAVWQTADIEFKQDESSSLSAAKDIIDIASGAGENTPDCTGALADDIAISIDETTDKFYIKACDDTSYTASDTGGTIQITIYGTTTTGTGTLTNATTIGIKQIDVTMDDEGSAAAHSGSIAVIMVDSDQVAVSATVDPTMAFDIDTAVTDTESAAAYSVALGTITTVDTRVSGATDSINSIWIDLETNATGGATVTVQNANGGNGMTSTSVPTNNIVSSTGALADGTERYGLCVASVTQATGATLAKAGTYTDNTCAADSETNDVDALTTTAADILTAPGPLTGGRAQIVVGAGISSITQAHNDYTDTLTFIATSTY